MIQIRRSTQECSILAPCRIVCSQFCGRAEKADFADLALGTEGYIYPSGPPMTNRSRSMAVVMVARTNNSETMLDYFSVSENPI